MISLINLENKKYIDEISETKVFKILFYLFNMDVKYCIITGSYGLVGSEAVKFFCEKDYNVIGIDNDMRKYFFNVSTQNITEYLISNYKI